MLFSDLPELSRQPLRELCVLLNADRNPKAFSAAFCEFFTERAARMLRLYAGRASSFDAMLELIAGDSRQICRTEAGQMFHINNELICRGSYIHSLVASLAERRGRRALCALMLTADEPGFVAQLRAEGFSAQALDPLYPALDYTNQADSAVECLMRLG